MARLSLKRRNFSDSKALIESAILNFTHLDGMFSSKLIDCYCLLGECDQDSLQTIINY